MNIDKRIMKYLHNIYDINYFAADLYGNSIIL